MIALTGATGFIGSSLARALSEKNIPFRCLVREKSKNLNRLEGLGAQTVQTDFSSVHSIASALDSCDLIIHVLGLINGSEAALKQVNVDFTRNLVHASALKKVQKIIFISSVAATMRHGSYGVTKHHAEEIVKQSDIPYLIFRPAWIFGPGDTTNCAMIIRTLKSSLFIPLLGGGTFKIQPVYVEDAVSLILQGIHFPKINTSYTIAGAEQVSLKEILQTFSGYMKLKRIFFPVPLKPLQAVLGMYLKLNPATKLPVKQILELDKHEAFDISETRRDFKFNPIQFSEGARRMFLCAA